MSDHNHVPLMFQAQVGGRSQIQRLIPSQKANQQAYAWARQWQDACDRDNIPQFEPHIQTREFAFTWRMVTNSGNDAGVIRPVIGERGWAYFPGSNMKGAFLRACKKYYPDQVLLLCGGEDQGGELHPGILRFHGGYPKDANWLNDSLVDVVHPQENWQTRSQNSHSAFIQISLYQPNFIFGISNTEELSDQQWETVWQIWNKALARGIGSRVSAGYGQVKARNENRLMAVGLSGQGLASQRIDRVGEFRPNVFKAALRGHTRRLFYGVTDADTAELITKQLWGGFEGRKEAVVGVLGVAFNAPELIEDTYTYLENGNLQNMPIYETGDASLNLLLMKDKNVSERDQKNLKIWVTQLVKFAMLLGGFGKSWRRVDHRLFSHQQLLPRYLTNIQNQNINPMIGCHWHYTDKSTSFYIPINDLKDVEAFLDKLHQTTHDFLAKGVLTFLRRKHYSINPLTSGIRESWCKENVQVWGRVAKNAEDSLAIAWFHRPYQGAESIKHSELTGWSSRNDRQPKTKIGRIWHRMYPRYLKQNDNLKPTEEYIELLTIFPNRDGDEVKKTENFLHFLEQETDFQQLW
jgi:CRISPR-associated protein Cmr6